MRRRSFPVGLGVVAGLLCTGVAPAAAASIVALPTTQAFWRSVNDSGVVVGGVGPSPLHAARWVNGVTTQFGTAGGFARAIDGAGRSFGVHAGALPADQRLAWWDANGTETLFPVAAPAEPNGLNAVSPSGAYVVGYNGTGPVIAQAPAYERSALPVECSITTRAVTDDGHVLCGAGMVVGGTYVAFADGFNGQAINVHDVVVGTAGSSQPRIRSAAGTITPLQLPAGATQAVPSAITDDGRIAGRAIYGDGDRAIIWPSSTEAPVFLDALLPAGAGWRTASVTAMTNSGYVLGSGLQGANASQTPFLANIGTPTRTISGTVRKALGVGDVLAGLVSGFTVRISGQTLAGAPFAATATTDATGAFSMAVLPGDYRTDTLPAGTCFANDDPDCTTRSAPLQVRNSDLGLDLIQLVGVFGGMITRRVCTETACTKAPLDGVVVTARRGATIVGTDTTFEDGSYIVTAPKGAAVTLAAAKTGLVFKPASVARTATGRQEGLDFAACVDDTGRTGAQSLCARPDFVIESVELNQGVQTETLPDTRAGGTFAREADETRLVAGRPLAVRVYVSDDTADSPPFASVLVRLTVTQGRATLVQGVYTVRPVRKSPVLPGARMLLQGDAIVQAVIDGPSLTTAPLTVRAVVDPPGRGAIEQCPGCERNDVVTRPYGAPVATRSPRIVVLPLARDADGRPLTPSVTASATAAGAMFGSASYLWPLATPAVDISIYRGAPLNVRPYVIGAGRADGSFAACADDAACATNLDNGLHSALRTWYAMAAPGAGVHVIAPTPREIGGVNGSTDGSLPLTWTRPTGGTAVHELEHQLGLGHADSVCGGGSNGQVHDPAWPSGTGSIGGYGIDFGPSLRGLVRTIGPPAAWFDILSYCRERSSDALPDTWASARNWTRLISLFAGSPATAGPVRAPARSPRLLVGARVVGGAATIGALVPTSIPVAGSSPNGAYTVRQKSRSGAIVAAVRTDLEATGEGQNGPPSALTVVMPLHPDATAIEIVDHAGAVIGARAAGGSPRVAIAAPRRGARVAGALRLRFAATGADAASVDLSIDDGRTWRTIAAAVTGSSVTIPARALSRSSSATIRVRATNGFAWSAAVVDGIRLAGAPPRLVLRGPVASNGFLKRGLKARLRVEARDDADRAIPGRKIVYRERRRILGRGPSLALGRLPLGKHRIAVTATDRFGRSAKATYVITIRR